MFVRLRLHKSSVESSPTAVRGSYGYPMASSFSRRFGFLPAAAIALLWGTCTPGMAQEKPVMRWLLVHFPPSTILVNDQPTNGTADEKLRLITERWPEVKHEFINAKPGRVWRELAEPDATACADLAIITPEREKQLYMAATSLHPPVAVIARPAVLRTLAKNAAGEVLPGALLDRNDLTGIVSPIRSYGAVIDSMLSGRSPKAHIETVLPWEGGRNILEMISTHRADYTLEFERTFTYLAASTPRLKDAGLQSAPIAGAKMNQVAIACPRNAWGYAAIKKIDAIITSLARDPEFQQLNSSWISAKEQAYMKRASEAFYKARAKPSAPDRYTPP